MLALPELPQLPQLRVLSRLACVRFFIKYEIIFYMKTRPLSPPSSTALLPTPSRALMPILVLGVDAFLWYYLWVALPRHYLSVFEGGSTHCVAHPVPSHHASGIDNKLYYWICLLPFVPSTVGQGTRSLYCPWGRDAADGVLTELPAPFARLCPIPVAPTANAASQSESGGA